MGDGVGGWSEKGKGEVETVRYCIEYRKLIRTGSFCY